MNSSGEQDLRPPSRFWWRALLLVAHIGIVVLVLTVIVWRRVGLIDQDVADLTMFALLTASTSIGFFRARRRPYR